MAEEQTGKNLKDKYISANGRRKEAVARVKLFEGAGTVIVNGKPIEEYIPIPSYRAKIEKVFNVSNTKNQFHFDIKVIGSGKAAQTDAIVLGLARALSEVNKDYRSSLKKAGFLTRDPRVKERRKFGLAQKARKGKQSPKR